MNESIIICKDNEDLIGTANNFIKFVKEDINRIGIDKDVVLFDYMEVEGEITTSNKCNKAIENAYGDAMALNFSL